jgi:hypothetical protein
MTTAQKVLLGCGIGCGVLILVVLILVAGGFFAISNIVEQFEETESAMEEVRDRYGRISDFTPHPEGIIRPERIEAFLSVREDMALKRQEMEQNLSGLSEVKEKGLSGSSRGALETIHDGLSLIPQIARFLTSRNQALLDSEMGLGEYYYLYVLAYYSWLGMSPADGPSFRLNGDSSDDDPFEIREDRRERILRHLRRNLLPMLRRQLSELDRMDGAGAHADWRESLQEEISLMEEDPYHLPWHDRLPQVLENSLSPYREDLEASYSIMCNPLEVTVTGNE